MLPLSTFLKKFNKITPPEKVVNDVFIKVVQKEVGVTLNPKEISVQKGVLFLGTHSIVKSEVILKRAVILEALAKEGLGIKIKDIK